MSYILNEPLELDGYVYPAGEPVDLDPATVGERLCLNGKAVPADVETADAFAAVTLGDAVVPPPAEIADLAVAPTPVPEVGPDEALLTPGEVALEDAPEPDSQPAGETEPPVDGSETPAAETTEPETTV